ncbi:MAG: efflux RND transporter periplasmic adaptor subunit [Opitutaceae bacterium]|jgi:HlyD family secretion protein
MAKSRFPIRLVIILVILGAAGLAAWMFWHRDSGKAPEISTAIVARGDVVQTVTASGSLEPVTSVEVSSQVSGLINQIMVDFNTPVKQGDVLARLDPATYEQRLKQAQADLASADANCTLVSVNTERTRTLRAKELVSQQELDQAEAQLSQAKAELLTRQSVVDDAKVNLARCTIYAPIDGIVLQRAAEVGKTVAASLNAPTLFIIANELASMQISTAVAEADIGNVENGQTVNFTVDAFPNRQFQGKVTQIRNYPTTVSNVVTYETIVTVRNDDLKLKPGMTANVSFVIAHRHNVLKLPNSALRVRVPDSLIAPKKADVAADTKDAPAPKPVSDDERRKIIREIMREVGFSRDAGPPTPEMIQRIQELAKQKGIEIDPARFGGKPTGGQASTTVIRTVYRLLSDDPAKPMAEAVSVKLGISDGTSTEVIEGLKENDAIVTGVVMSGTNGTTSASPANPFSGGPRFGR